MNIRRIQCLWRDLAPQPPPNGGEVFEVTLFRVISTIGRNLYIYKSERVYRFLARTSFEMTRIIYFYNIFLTNTISHLSVIHVL